MNTGKLHVNINVISIIKTLHLLFNIKFYTHVKRNTITVTVLKENLDEYKNFKFKLKLKVSVVNEYICLAPRVFRNLIVTMNLHFFID